MCRQRMISRTLGIVDNRVIRNQSVGRLRQLRIEIWITNIAFEAKKITSIPYAFEKEYPYNQNCRFNSPIDKIKLIVIRIVFRFVNVAYLIAKRIGLTKLVKWAIKVRA